MEQQAEVAKPIYVRIKSLAKQKTDLEEKISASRSRIEVLSASVIKELEQQNGWQLEFQKIAQQPQAAKLSKEEEVKRFLC